MWRNSASLRPSERCLKGIMSGIAAGLAYSGAFRTKPFLEAAAPIWKRSWTLYVVHIFLTLVGVALFAGGAAYFGLPELLRMNNIGPIYLRND